MKSDFKRTKLVQSESTTHSVVSRQWIEYADVAIFLQPAGRFRIGNAVCYHVRSARHLCYG